MSAGSSPVHGTKIVERDKAGMSRIEMVSGNAAMVELADTQVSKTCGTKVLYRFKSDLRYYDI